MDLPVISGAGTLTRDPEVRFIANGDAVVSVDIAMNARKYNKDTQKYEDGEPTFLKGSCWRQMAENVAESLRKGSRVVFVGKLKQENWEQDGNKRSTLKVEIDEIGPSLKFGAKKSADPWGG